MAETLEIIIKARDDASKVLKGVKGDTVGLKDATKLLGGAFAATAAVGAVMAKVLKDGEQLIMKQAKAERDLARTIGSTVTQAGMLIEAADDMMVSQETLTTAMETAIRKGYSPTISGLGTIADAYNAIQDPIAKAKYLMDTFGRSGADMAPMMAVGRAALEEMGQSALLNGQVISESQARMARASEIASDGLGDSWDTLRKRMASPFLPIKIYIEEHITKVIEDANRLDYGIRELGLTQARVGPNMVYWQDQFGKVIAHTRLELEAYIAKQMLRVQWDENALGAVERLRAGMSLKPADWLQNTTTIHTTVERAVYEDWLAETRGEYQPRVDPSTGTYARVAEDYSPGSYGIARGGPLTGFNIVGEEGPEIIINGVVIPADETRDLLRRGVKPSGRFGTGGSLWEGGITEKPATWNPYAGEARLSQMANARDWGMYQGVSPLLGTGAGAIGNAPSWVTGGGGPAAAVEAAIAAASASAAATVGPTVVAAVGASVPGATVAMAEKQTQMIAAGMHDLATTFTREMRSLKQELSRSVASAVQKVI